MRRLRPGGNGGLRCRQWARHIFLPFFILLGIRCVTTIIVATDIQATKLRHCAAGFEQKHSQRLKPFAPQMAELPAVGRLHRIIQAA
jgi:hypothetical protein